MWLSWLFSAKPTDDLETRVRRLEERDAERHLLTLAAVERVSHQLRDRIKKRARDEASPEGSPAGSGESAPPAAPRPLRSMRGF